MPKFRKKPVVIEAVRVTRPMVVETLEGVMRGDPGDWLITGVKGEQYFCKHEIFAQTYEPVDDEARTALAVALCEGCSPSDMCPCKAVERLGFVRPGELVNCRCELKGEG